jgi:hypothetical protein
MLGVPSLSPFCRSCLCRGDKARRGLEAREGFDGGEDMDGTDEEPCSDGSDDASPFSNEGWRVVNGCRRVALGSAVALVVSVCSRGFENGRNARLSSDDSSSAEETASSFLPLPFAAVANLPLLLKSRLCTTGPSESESDSELEIAVGRGDIVVPSS